ncbi:MAG: TIGR03546 family protein [Oligoflexales bacterium]
MTLILKQIFSLIKLLNSETGTIQIASGIACGMILGFAPFFSLQTLLVWAVVFLFRIQLSAALISAFFFKLCSYLFDPAFDVVGAWVLELQQLRDLFVFLYNLPIVPFTRFNNTIAMGSLVASVALSPLCFWGAKILIEKYRTAVVARFKNTKFWLLIKQTSLYQWYYKYEELYGDS